MNTNSLIDHLDLDRLNSLLVLRERLLHALVTELVGVVIAQPFFARNAARDGDKEAENKYISILIQALVNLSGAGADENNNVKRAVLRFQEEGTAACFSKIPSGDEKHACFLRYV